MQVVIDTNIFLGACLGTGAANHAVAACLRGQSTPLMGTALLTEYEDILGRSELFDQCRLTLKERNDLLDIFLSVCESVQSR